MSAIERLFSDPQSFDFFQAVRLIERWLASHGLSPEQALTFQNSVALGYPVSQVEALWLDHAEPRATEADLVRALLAGDGDRQGQVRMTPAFIGLLGSHGVLPIHYSEDIAAQLHVEKEQGGRAFLDLFSSRLVALFYQAWRKYRLELSGAHGGGDRLMPLLLALSGAPPGHAAQPVPDEVAAYYAAAFRQRPSSAAAIQRVLQDYFQIPVAITSCVGYWQRLDPALQMTLGGDGVILGENCMLGPDTWRRDLRVGIRLGPLDKASFDHFLPDAPGALALQAMLAMFAVPTLQCEVCLVLRAADVPPMILGPHADGDPGVRLGMDTFLIDGHSDTDRDDVRYLIRPL